MPIRENILKLQIYFEDEKKLTIATCSCFAAKTQFVDLLQKCITIKRWRKPMMIFNWLDKMRTKSAHSINTFCSCSCSVQLFQRQDADGLHIQYSPCLFFDVLSRLVSTTPPAIGRFQVTQRKLKLRCLPQTNRQARCTKDKSFSDCGQCLQHNDTHTILITTFQPKFSRWVGLHGLMMDFPSVCCICLLKVQGKEQAGELQGDFFNWPPP